MEHGISKSCSDAPLTAPSCLTVGRVAYTYGIGEFDVTVSQYVTFLNTVDPRGKNLHDLYNDDMSPTNWPQYGSVRFTSSAASGQHYSVAYPQWADKPFNFADFRREARFVNSLTNGKVLSKASSSSGSFKYVTYTVRLSTRTETGMYKLANPATTRGRSSGFVIPNNNEWVKAAYFDPKGGGTDSYWAYPTDPFKQPNVAVLNPGTGDVENAADQPLATYNPNDPNSSVDSPGAPSGAAPTWCPYQAGSSCGDLPPDIPRDSTWRRPTRRTSAPWVRTRLPPLGVPTTRGQRGRAPRDTRATTSGVSLPPGLAVVPRRRCERTGISVGDLGLRLCTGSLRRPTPLSLAGLPRGGHREPLRVGLSRPSRSSAGPGRSTCSWRRRPARRPCPRRPSPPGGRR